jgi:two-component system sensor histidine kinase SenX3
VLVLVAVLALAAGVLAGAALTRRTPERPAVLADEAADGALPVAIEAAVRTLSTGVVVLDDDENAVWTNPAADAMRIVRRGRIAAPALARVARGARGKAGLADEEIELAGGREVRAVAARVAGGAYVALLVDDTTAARRVDAIRRDFVANVSHELKTPVGAMSLLAEAIQDCGDDPDAVRRFADRMRVESARLSRLVQELIDLSRLQGAEPMRTAAAVPVRSFVNEAVDRTRLAATASDIDVVVHVDEGLVVPGDERQLATAVANLLDNAVAYSPPHTRVAVTARRRDDEVDVAVTDQGIGIAPADRERVFERFYRVDPARSRETGGTGLGLAIVKHIATNHRGRVDVWSVEGTGSTFTLTVPASLAAVVPPSPTKEGVPT